MTQLSFSNLRIYVDKSVHQIYKDLTGGAQERAEDTPFSKMPDLFVAAACVGARNNSFIAPKDKQMIFFADAFDAKIHVPVLISLAYKKTKDITVLTESKKILEISQGWANGGIHFLHEQMLQGQKGLLPLYKLTDYILELVPGK